MQILYLLGVGLLLTFDLLACVDSQGMLYYILMPKCNTTYRMLLKIYPFKQTPSPPLTEIKWINLKRGNRLPSLDVNFYKAFFQGIKCQRSYIQSKEQTKAFQGYSECRYCISSIWRHGYYFFRCSLLCGYYVRVASVQGWSLFLQKTHGHQRRLDKVRMSDTVMTAKRCQ